MRHRVIAYLLLPHTPAIVAVVGATALFGLLATDGHPPVGRFSLLLLAMLGGQIAIGALNEWCDREADALAQPSKPIPSGLVTPGGALVMLAAGVALMLAAGVALGALSFGLLLAGTGCGIAYDLGLKRTPLSWLPYLLALPLVPTWVWITLDTFEPRLLLLYPLGALLVVAVHLAQTLPDIEGDRAAGERGLAATLGHDWSLRLLWLAGFASAGVVALGTLFVGRHPLAGLIAAAAAAGVLGVLFILRIRSPQRVEAHLFEPLAVCAVVLAAGWVTSVM
jgi:4-hydroxybenzoate polyprenyltransferase